MNTFMEPIAPINVLDLRIERPQIHRYIGYITYYIP